MTNVVKSESLGDGTTCVEAVKTIKAKIQTSHMQSEQLEDLYSARSKRSMMKFSNSMSSKRALMEYYDTICSSYDLLYGREQIDKFRIALSHVKLGPTDVVLDVGCGTGILLEEIAGKAKMVIGTDVSGKMLNEAKHKLRSFPTAFLIHADADHLPFKDRTFDKVFAITLLQNMPDPKITLRELKRVSKEGSPLVVTGLKKKFALEFFTSLIEEAQLKLVVIEDREDIKDHIAVARA